ncbi:MAG: hypothetical protein D6722_04770 [Bacteroidetes bacterium]|nr:MAG: hypothetical protein D6722_04770 [Bacteroidota bacterium]
MAQEYLAEHPGDEAGRLEIAWVHYGFVKKAAKAVDLPAFHEHVDAILAQELEGEGIMGNSLAWQVHRVAKALLGEKPVRVEEIVKMLDKVRFFTFDIESDIMAYVMMLRLALKVKDRYEGLREFIEWWDLENLPEAEYEPFETKQGRRMMSLAERSYITYANQLIQLSDTDSELAKEKAVEFWPKFAELGRKRRDYRFFRGFRLPLLGVMGRWDEVIQEVLSEIRHHPNDPNAWILLGDALAHQQEENQALICFARALTSRAKPDAMIKAKEKLARILVKQERYVEARTEYRDILSFLERLGEHPSPSVLAVQEEAWFKETEPRPNNKGLYRHYSIQADNLLYADMPELSAVVNHTDDRRKRLWFRVDREVTGSASFGQLGFRVAPGDFIAVRIKKERAPDGSDRYRLLTARPNDEAPPGIIRMFRGLFSMKQGQSFGFVDREIFIPPHLVEEGLLMPGQAISGMAVMEYDQKRNRWSWKAVKLG